MRVETFKASILNSSLKGLQTGCRLCAFTSPYLIWLEYLKQYESDGCFFFSFRMHTLLITALPRIKQWSEVAAAALRLGNTWNTSSSGFDQRNCQTRPPMRTTPQIQRGMNMSRGVARKTITTEIECLLAAYFLREANVFVSRFKILRA